MKQKAIINQNGVLYLRKNADMYVPQLCCRMDRWCVVNCIAFNNIGQIDSASKNGGKEYIINTCENKFYVKELVDMRNMSILAQSEISKEMQNRGEL